MSSKKKNMKRTEICQFAEGNDNACTERRFVNLETIGFVGSMVIGVVRGLLEQQRRRL